MIKMSDKESQLNYATENNLQLSGDNVLDESVQAIIDAIDSGQNVDAVIKREQAKRNLRDYQNRRFLSLGA